ncbi:MAG: Na+/H+ antiporter NhaC family protein [Anaerovoracaceae bacterium]
MALLIAFIVFLISMIAAIFTEYSMIIALLIGLVAFSAAAAHKGFGFKEIGSMALEGAKDSLIVIKVMCVIGLVTAAWRVSGTITIFVYYGMKIITPSLFLLIAFLLSCLLSYALGTSFGVAGTVGVIFMTLARSGGVDPVITAGVLMSGIYFGDRGSPVSSSANMVAAVTGTEIFDNVKIMMRTALVPLAITLAVYAVLSFLNPISHVDAELVAAFEREFVLSPWVFIPAAIMLILPLLKVSVLISMGLSILSGVLVAWLIQGVALPEILKICILGYEAQGEGLSSILNGGGLVSMLEIVFILLISSSYSGIFSGTGLLDELQEKLSMACTRLGRFAVMLIMSTCTAAVFCNQTISTLMCCDLMKKPYLDSDSSINASVEASMTELAIDMENSVILIACFIPWSIGCSVPLSFFGADFHSLPFAVYMYAVPICYMLMKKRWFSGDAA